MFTSTKTCVICGDGHDTVLRGPLYEFCASCRSNLHLLTFKEAEDILDILEGVKPEERAGVIVAVKAARQTRWLAQQSLPEFHHRGGGGTSNPPEKPRINLAVVKAAVRSMTTYGTLADDRVASDPSSPTEYVIAKNGLFEVIHTDVADIIRIPKVVQGVDTILTEGVVPHLPPIPFDFLRQTVAFFKQVCVKHANAEAFVRIWWNRREERYEIQVPKQQVSGGGVHHTDDFDRDNRGDWLVAADIHSHNSMGAFWSGVDDADEKKAPEGRIHGVIGKVPTPLPEWKWRMRVRDGFLEMNAGQIFGSPGDDLAFTVGWNIILASLGDSKLIDEKGRMSLMCPVNPWKDATFPAEWMEQVSGYQAWGGNRGIGFSRGDRIDSRFSGTQFLYILDVKTGVAREMEVIDGKVGNPTGKSLPVFGSGAGEGEVRH